MNVRRELVLQVRMTGQSARHATALVVGSGPDCSLVLEDTPGEAIPPRAFRIEFVGGVPLLRCEATGICVNGGPVVREKVLQDGDRIRIGDRGTELVFRIEAEALAPSMAAARRWTSWSRWALPVAAVAAATVAVLWTVSLAGRVGEAERTAAAASSRARDLEQRVVHAEGEVERLRRTDPAVTYESFRGGLAVLQNKGGAMLGTGFLLRRQDRCFAVFCGTAALRGEHTVSWQQPGGVGRATVIEVERGVVRDRGDQFFVYVLPLPGDRGFVVPEAPPGPRAGGDVRVLYHRADLAAAEQVGLGAFFAPRILAGTVSRLVSQSQRMQDRFTVVLAHGGLERGLAEADDVRTRYGLPLGGALVVDGDNRWLGMLTGWSSRQVGGVTFVEFEGIGAAELVQMVDLVGARWL